MMLTFLSCFSVFLVGVLSQAPPLPVVNSGGQAPPLPVVNNGGKTPPRPVVNNGGQATTLPAVNNGGQAPPLPGANNVCEDHIDSCASFPESSCKEPYLEWAKKNCNRTCKFCVYTGPGTPPPPCEDTKKNCEIYTKAVCSKTEYNTWVNENCRAFCKRCTAEQLAHLTTTTTTIAPKDCYDKVDCRTYGANACAKSFEDWSKDNCPLTCGYCHGTPTIPPLCVDRIPNCKAYNPTTCTDPDFKIWVEDNCKKFCNLC